MPYMCRPEPSGYNNRIHGFIAFPKSTEDLFVVISNNQHPNNIDSDFGKLLPNERRVRIYDLTYEKFIPNSDYSGRLHFRDV